MNHNIKPIRKFETRFERPGSAPLPKRVLIILPAYNEADSIGGVISDINRDVPGADIIVINDGSRDATAHIARGLGIRVIDLPYNMGIGAAMQTGFIYAAGAGYDIAVQVDADGQHPPDQIDYLIAPIMQGSADVVIGSRFLGRGDYHPSFSRNIGIKIFSTVISLLTGHKVTDTTSGFRAVGKNALNLLAGNYPDDYPEVEAIILMHKAGLNIMEVPVRMKERMAGRSSITPLHSIYYMTKVMLAVLIDVLKK